MVIGVGDNSNVFINAANGVGGWSNVPTSVTGGYSRGLVPLSNGCLFVIKGGTWAGPNTVTYGDVEVGGNYNISTDYYFMEAIWKLAGQELFIW